MPRTPAVSSEYNFSKGLITQATGLNFPENACIDTYNCVFEETGEVNRRQQIDFEDQYITETIDRNNRAITTYQWKGVASEGDFSIVVVQIGLTLYFYDTTTDIGLSNGLYTGQIDLSTYITSVGSEELQKCTFTSGIGYLFVFHPNADPIYISYNPASRTFSASSINVQIRDYVGLNDNLAVDNRPTSSISDSHLYNLYNQGWASDITRTDAVTFTNGSPNVAWANHGLSVGDIVYFTTAGTLPTNFLANTTYYVVSIVDPDKITVSATQSGSAISAGSAGSGTHAGYTYNPYDIWTTFRSDYPSNADVWWDYKDETNSFDIDYVKNKYRGSTPAPKGHYILDLFDQDRSDASGIVGIANVTYTSRPSVGCFYAGRLWMSGINTADLNDKIYYSQTIEDVTQFGKCYQQGDPTSEDSSVLLATDGGVISIQEMGGVNYMYATRDFLYIFATNGVWAITGSQGIGFTATDYTIRNISSIRSVAYDNFVVVDDTPIWWNIDGIYALSSTENGYSTKSLTDTTIKDFYSTIPVLCKKQAKGAYNALDNTIQWLFRLENDNDFNKTHEYTHILNMNTITGAFYPWTISYSTDSPKIHAIVVTDVTGFSNTVAFDVIDGSSDLVIDGSGNQVISFNYSSFATSTTTTKFLTSFYDGGYKFTWSEARLDPVFTGSDYTDWYKYDSVGMDYTSYLVSGYKLHGDGQRKFQSNYLYIFAKTEDELSIFDAQARWDYSISDTTGRWNIAQRVEYERDNYTFQRKRLKMRGNGITVQFKFTSVTGQPMKLAGWSVFETSNSYI